MKQLTDELVRDISFSHAGCGKKSFKWDRLYDNEAELIADMFNEKIIVDGYNVYKMCKGYEYIKSFRRYYEKNGSLTEKQMTQLKRLAAEIAYHIYVCK